MAQAHIVIALAFGAPEMGQKNGASAGAEHVAHGRYDFFNTRGVGYSCPIHRDVNVNTYQNAFTSEVHIVESFPAHVFVPFPRVFIFNTSLIYRTQWLVPEAKEP